MTIETTIDEAGERRYVLPWRKFGARRWRGVLDLVVSAAICVWLAVSFGLNFLFWVKLVLAVAAAARGMFLLLPSRMEVVAGRDGLRWREAGWIRTRWKTLPWSLVSRFELDSPHYYLRSWNPLDSAGETHLVAIVSGKWQAFIITAYPRQLVESMVPSLQEDYRRWSPTIGTAEPVVAVVDVSMIPPMSHDLDERPEGCQVTMVESEHGRTFVFQRFSRLGITLRLLGIALVCCIAWVMLGGLFWGIMEGLHRHANGWPQLAALVVVVSVAILGIRQIWRQVVIVANADGLVVAWSGPLRRREQMWRRDQITAVDVERGQPQSFSVQSDRPEVWLTVQASGNKHRVAGGRSDDWRWVATQMRKVMGVEHITSVR